MSTDWLAIGKTAASIFQGGVKPDQLFNTALNVGVTAALTPFLGPFAGLVSGPVTKLIKGTLGKLVSGVAGLFGKQARAPERYTEADEKPLLRMGAMREYFRNDPIKSMSVYNLFDAYDYAVATNNQGQLNILRQEIMRMGPDYNFGSPSFSRLFNPTPFTPPFA